MTQKLTLFPTFTQTIPGVFQLYFQENAPKPRTLQGLLTEVQRQLKACDISKKVFANLTLTELEEEWVNEWNLGYLEDTLLCEKKALLFYIYIKVHESCVIINTTHCGIDLSKQSFLLEQ